MSRRPFCSPDPVAEGFVLAGGRSSRMGRDKSLIPISGRTFVAIALDKLRALHLSPAGTPRIAGSRPDLAAYAPVVEDLHPGCGPLSGIEAALAVTAAPLNLFVPVDLPLLPAEFLAWMLARTSITGALVTYPRVNGLAQPLCAIYHRDLLASITRSLAGGNYKVTHVLAAAVREVAAPSEYSQAIDTFDLESVAAACSELRPLLSVPLYRWFQNCNSPEDLAAFGEFLQTA